MCTGLEIALIAGTTMSAGATIMQGQQAKQSADANAELMRRQGEADKDAAVAQAEKIRKASRYEIGAANAANAASGVDLNWGTPVRINEQINRNAESDAYATILTGARRQTSANDQAMLTSAAGSATANASLLAAGGKVANGWSIYKKGGKVE